MEGHWIMAPITNDGIGIAFIPRKLAQEVMSSTSIQRIPFAQNSMNRIRLQGAVQFRIQAGGGRK